MGQRWVDGMFIQTATSLWCAKDGFRVFIFGFLVFCVVNMIVGHAAIREYQRDLARQKGIETAKLDGVELQDIAAATQRGPGGARAMAAPRMWLKRLHGVS